MVRPMVVCWVKAPDLPVIVTVKVPRVARLLGFTVNVLVDVVGLGPKEAETPLGKPETESVTLLLKPFEGVMVILVVPLPRRPTLRLAGEAESEKFGPGVMVSESGVELLKFPEVPVTITVKVPVAALALAATVSWLVPVVLVGLKDAVTPLGRPVATRLTVPLKPLSGLTVMLLVP